MAEKKSGKYKVKVPKINASGRTYDFSLSLPGMISAVGIGVLALTFFFVMGILIGRGYRPEADVPQLGEIMPVREHGVAVEEPVKPEILKPEELEYPERLKASPEKMMEDGQAVAEVKKVVAQKAKTAASPKPAAQEKPEVYKPTPAKDGEPVYDYTYQVASFRKADMAEALSAKLVDAGLRTNISSGEAKGSMWYRVQVLHHGTPASTADMKAVLARHGIGKPLLRKKTAVQ